MTPPLDQSGRPTSTRYISYRQWTCATAFAEGTLEGTQTRGDALVVAQPHGTLNYVDPFGDGSAATYEVASWTSPLVTPPEPFDELIASWNARTPPGTWIEVAAEVVRRGEGVGRVVRESFVLGRWAEDASAIHRTSVVGQASDLARVDFDVLVAVGAGRLDAWRLVVRFLRPVGSDLTPEVTLAGAMVSAASRGSGDSTVWRGLGAGRGGESDVMAGATLDVPPYSQCLHRGEYPEHGGGGEAWCSPTSTSMVLGFWNRLPPAQDYTWVDAAYVDRWIDHAAAQTFDHAYGGAGNWSFNVAYAAEFGLEAFVTRLRSLGEARQFINAGIPLVASVTFTRNELAGAEYDTDGHLLVIRGFTAAGDVVVNDPASHLQPSNDEVEIVYAGREFERVWLAGSGGLVYAIHPRDVRLPTPPAGRPPNWPTPSS